MENVNGEAKLGFQDFAVINDKLDFQDFEVVDDTEEPEVMDDTTPCFFEIISDGNEESDQGEIDGPLWSMSSIAFQMSSPEREDLESNGSWKSDPPRRWGQ